MTMPDLTLLLPVLAQLAVVVGHLLVLWGQSYKNTEKDK